MPKKKGNFIAIPQPQDEASRNRRALLLFGLSLGYGLLIPVLYLNTVGLPSLRAFSTYAYGILGGYGIFLVNRSYRAAHRGRDLMTELLEKSAEARLITGPDGGAVYFNQSFSRLVGEAAAPTLAAFVALTQDPGQTLRQLESLRRSAAVSGSASAEARLPGRSGGLSYFQVTCQVIEGWAGYAHWLFDDVSERRRMEVLIAEERKTLRDFSDNAPVGFFSVGEDGTFLFANDTLLRLLGADAKSLVGRAKLHDFLVDPPKGARACDCFAEGGERQHGELSLRGAGGRVFRAAVTHSVSTSADGHLISRSIVHDLTDEQRMIQALKDSEDRFQRLFEEAPVGICLLSSEGVISSANQALSRILGVVPEALNGKSLLQFVQDDARGRTKDWLASLRGAAEGQIDLTLKAKSEIVAQICARRMSAGDSFVVHFIDLTDEKNLERQVSQSQKMQAIGQLAGGIAHDFNNLLTAMIGFCDLLLLRHKPGDASFSDIMQIKQNANRAANLVRQLLAFSRQQTLQARVLNLTGVLVELSHLLRRLIGANIELRVNHGADLGLIRADQGQVEQVLINLAVNARDAMPEGGKLTIQTYNTVNPAARRLASEEILPPGKWVTIEVDDTGTGIPPDVLPRIFEPFFSTKDVGAGTGLGLATAHGIVHQTGGFIDVRTVVGQGTRFTIYLPSVSEGEAGADKKAAAPEEKQAATDLTGSSKILLVEDEDAVRTFSARALSNKGYEVAEAASGATALQMLEEGKVAPDVLVTDVMMPEMDGTTLARIVREKYPHIKIVFISGYAEDRLKEHLGAGVWFLPKPFTLKQLAAKIKDVIDDVPQHQNE